MSRVPAALVWDPALTGYRFRPDHPFNPRRLELTVSLIEALGLLDGGDARMVPPRPATDAELEAVHGRAYLDAVKRFSAGGDARDAHRWGLGTDDTPIFPGMHEITSLVCGGSIRAAELVMGGEVKRAFNLCGGLHHAHRDRGSGFCVYSDLAASIAWIRREHGGKVMYIDYDAHHGDGVQGIFYDDPDVLTLSLHESGRYLFPGTGFVDELGEGEGYGYSLNVPLEPFTEDGSWLDIHRKLIPEVMEAFRPDVVVLQSGCDGHALDPLTHLRASTRLAEETTRIVCEAADAVCGGRVVATGGGGYAVWEVVPRAWTLVWAALSGQEVPTRIPRDWLERWQGEAPVLLRETVRDVDEDHRPVPRRDEIEATNRRTLESLRRQALPLIRGYGLGF